MAVVRNLLRMAFVIALAYLAADFTAVAARHSLSPAPRAIRPRAALFERSPGTRRRDRDLSFALSTSEPEPVEVVIQATPPAEEPSAPDEPLVLDEPEVSPPPELPPAEGLTFSLKGVLAGTEVKVAIVEKDGDTFFLKEGEEFEGFRVVQVEDLSVTLDDGNERRLLMLKAAGGP